MHKIVVFFFFLFTSLYASGRTTAATPITLFVKTVPSGDGSGSSWSNAFDGKKLALYLRNSAVDGAKIYVAAGTYIPYDATSDNAATAREYSFEAKKAIRITGGYSALATGTDTSSYNPTANITRLSGEIQDDGNAANNSYHVVTASNASSIQLKGFYISYGYADGSGGFSSGGGIHSSAKVTLTDVVVNNNTATGNGGGMHASANVTFNRVSVLDNTSLTGQGGGLFLASGATLLTNNSTISGNSAKEGGGASIAGWWTDNTTTTTVSGNTASNSGGGIYATGTLSLTEVTIRNNTVTGGNGGGIYTTGQLLIGGTSFIEANKAGGNGGGIYFKPATALVVFCGDPDYPLSISGNTSGGSGGGFYFEPAIATSQLFLENAIISNNTAKTNGGGVITTGALMLTNTTMSGNKAGYDAAAAAFNTTGSGGALHTTAALTLAGNIIFENNGAYTDGGAICKISGGAVTSDELIGLAVNRNTAYTGNGGGIYTGTAFNIGNLTLTGNIAGLNGGGVFLASLASPLVTITGSTIADNSTKGKGGGIYSDVALKIGNTTFSGNKAGYDAGTDVFSGVQHGGGIFANNSLTLQGTVEFKNNIASENGGAIWKSNGTFATTDLTSAVFDNNMARNGSGGGVHSGTTFEAAGWDIKNNQAGTTGGGINVTSGIAVTINGGSITGNTAKTNGGGIYAAGALTLQGAVNINGNKATTGSGGGIYKSNSGAFTATGLTALTVSGNTASGALASTGGGGIYSGIALDFTNNNNAQITISNNSSSAKAGAIYANSGLTLPNATLAGNKSLFAGGAIYISGGSGNISNSNLSGNMSKNEGGAVYAESIVPLTLNNTTISNNKAGYDHTATPAKYVIGSYTGGGVSANNVLILQGDMVFRNDTIAGNGGAVHKSTLGAFNTVGLTSLVVDGNATIGSTAAHGGGIYSGAALSLTGPDITISNNSAAGYGGGIYAGSTAQLNNIAINNNKAWNYGGGVYVYGALTLQGAVTVDGNKTTTGAGGGLYVYSTFTANDITSLQVTNNTSGGDGGGIWFNSTATSITLGKPGVVTNISGNIAKQGGGIYYVTGASTAATLTIQNATFSGNTSSGTGSGGGIFVKGPTLGTAFLTITIIDAILSDNRAGWDFTTNKWSTGSGGAIHAEVGNVDLILKGTVAIENNVTGNAGGGILYSQAKGSIIANEADITLLKINNNKAITNSGGGICTYTSGYATISLANAQINNNTAKIHGGGIYSYGGALTLNNTTISNNKAGYDIATGKYAGIANGGGVYANNTLTLKGTMVFSNDTAVAGGAIYKTAAGAFTGPELTLLSITGNAAMVDGGGGIYTSAPTTLQNATISDNTAIKSGGGILVNTAKLTLIDNTISGNRCGWDYATVKYSTGGNGGGIFITASGASLDLRGRILIENNTSGNGGGGIYYQSSSAFMAGTELTSLIVRKNISMGTSSGGGGIYTDAPITLENTPEVTISDNTALGYNGGGIQSASAAALSIATADLSGNMAKGNGGAVYAGSALTLNNSTISNNKAGYDVTSKKHVIGANKGGGVYVGGMLTLKGDITFQTDTVGAGTTAGGGGGAIYANNSITATGLSSLLVDANAAKTAFGATTNLPNAGGIHAGGTVTITGSTGAPVTISNNSAPGNGGGLYFSGSTCNISYARITGNEAYNGGGFNLAAGSMSFSNSTIDSNKANGNGGGIHAGGTGTLNMVSTTVSDNKAVGQGGGAYITAAGTLQNTSVMGNMAKGNGGGIGLKAAALTLTNDSISGNRAGWDFVNSVYVTISAGGGGVYVDGTIADVPSLLLNENIVCENNISGKNGGGICYDKANVNFITTGLTKLTVRGNEAKGMGGGIYTAGSLTINTPVPSNVGNNKAEADGGGFYVGTSASSLDLTNLRLTNNSTIINGGAICGTGASVIRVANSAIINNTATGKCGGIFSGSGNLTLANDTISGNKGSIGGGVYASSGLIMQGDMVFEKNIATANGGAIYKLPSGTVTTTGLTSVLFNRNESGAAGGAVYTTVELSLLAANKAVFTGNKANDGGAVNATNKLTLEAATLLNNTAANNGGAIYKNVSGTMTIAASILAENTAASGGAVWTATNTPTDVSTMVNCTFSRNTATASSGGAVYSQGPSGTAAVNITLCAFSGNTASTNTGNAIYYDAAKARILRGNIIYGNGNGGTEVDAANSSLSLLAATYNITRGQLLAGTGNRNIAASEGANIYASATGDIADLADNGGPTRTFAIKQGGYAHNFIPTATASAWGTYPNDQRGTGFNRSVGCKTDAGSFETQTLDIPVVLAITGPAEVCTGDRTSYGATPGMNVYQWELPAGGIIDGSSTATTSNIVWGNSISPPVYNVKVTVLDTNNCDNSIIFPVTVKHRTETGPLYRLPNR